MHVEFVFILSSLCMNVMFIICIYIFSSNSKIIACFWCVCVCVSSFLCRAVSVDEMHRIAVFTTSTEVDVQFIADRSNFFLVRKLLCCYFLLILRSSYLFLHMSDVSHHDLIFANWVCMKRFQSYAFLMIHSKLMIILPR